MRTGLKWYIELSNEVESIAFDVISSTASRTDPPELFHAHATLVVRVLQDLRVSEIAALNGYIMQSWTVACSAFEAANLMGFLAAKPERAKRWLAYSDTTKSFVNVFDAIRGTLSFLKIGEAAGSLDNLVRNEYALYGQLCMAKHINPLPEKNRYWVPAGPQTRLMFTPFFTPGVVQQARRGLALVNRSAAIATWIFARSHHTAVTMTDERFASLALRTVEGLEKSLSRSTARATME